MRFGLPVLAAMMMLLTAACAGEEAGPATPAPSIAPDSPPATTSTPAAEGNGARASTTIEAPSTARATPTAASPTAGPAQPTATYDHGSSATPPPPAATPAARGVLSPEPDAEGVIRVPKDAEFVLPIEVGYLWRITSSDAAVVDAGDGMAKPGPQILRAGVPGHAEVDATGFLTCHFAKPACLAPNPFLSFIVIVE